MTPIRRVDYDAENDILYIAFSDQHDSYGDEISDNVVVRRRWSDDGITGFTIFEFMVLFESGSAEIRSLPVDLNFEKQILPFCKH